jgi:hypothetical protein
MQVLTFKKNDANNFRPKALKEKMIKMRDDYRHVCVIVGFFFLSSLFVSLLQLSLTLIFVGLSDCKKHFFFGNRGIDQGCASHFSFPFLFSFAILLRLVLARLLCRRPSLSFHTPMYAWHVWRSFNRVSLTSSCECFMFDR